MTETISTLDVLKKRYVGSVIDKAVPFQAKLIRDIPFRQSERVGGEHIMAVNLKWPQGLTYSGGANLGTGFTLNAALPGSIAQIKATGSEVVLRERFSHGLLSMASGGETSFDPALDTIVGMTVQATAYALEEQLLYGNSPTGLGVVSAKSGSFSAAVITMTTASWASGIWACKEGAKVDIYDVTGVTKRTANGAAVISSIDDVNKTITLVMAAAADYTATVATDFIVPFGSAGNTFDGIDKLVTTSASGSGTVLGINVANSGLWRANTYAVGSTTLTFAKLMQACTRAMARSGMTDDLVLYCNPFTFNDLMTEQAALRRYGSQTKIGDFENGADSLSFVAPTGRLTIVPHIMIKLGEAYLINPKVFHRIGSAEPQFGLPGNNSEQFFSTVPDAAAYEIRRYYEQGLSAELLACNVKLTGITNSAS